MSVREKRLLADRSFLRYWTARVISTAGSAATLVAMPVLMYDITGSGLMTGLTTALESLPYVIFGLPAGALADRVDRRRMMVVSDLVSGVGLLSIPFAFSLGILTPVALLAIAAVNAIALVYFDAAHLGALIVLVGRERLVSASATIWRVSTLMEIVVPVACGSLLAWLSPAVIMAFDGASFLLSALLIRAVTRPLWDRSRDDTGRDRSGAVQEALRGLRHLWRVPALRWMTLVDLAQCTAGGIELGQLVPFSATGLAAGSSHIGLLFTAWGLGGLAATLLLDRVVQRFGPIRATLWALPLSAASGLMFAVSDSWAVAAALLGLWGGFYIMTVLIGVTYRQLAAPEHLQSRVNATGRMVTWGLGLPTGGLLGGALSALGGPRVAMVASGLLILVTAAAGWLSPLRSAARHA